MRLNGENGGVNGFGTPKKMAKSKSPHAKPAYGAPRFVLGLIVRASRHCSRIPSRERETTQTSHSQNDAELGVAAHHTRVSLTRLLERVGFNHGTHATQFGEAQGVFGIGGRSRGPALNAVNSKNELCGADFDGLKFRSHDYEVAVRPQTVDQLGHRFRV